MHGGGCEMKVLLLPLDERPCNIKFPVMVAHSGDVDICVPDLSVLGDKKKPACHRDVKEYVLTHAHDCDTAIISIDMLVYGGLVPSRVHRISCDDAISRLEVLNELRRINPELRIYAFSSVMRAPQYNSDDEEPDYYARYGEQLFRRAYLADKLRRVDLNDEERAELKSIRVPGEVIDDYENRRRTNLTVNMAVLDLVKAGSVDYLVFPQDDSSPFGYTAVTQEKLHAAITRRDVHRKVSIYPGSDEVAMTLLARSVCKHKRIVPVVRPHYSSVMGPTLVPLYEDRPMYESLKAHVKSAGARLCDPDEKPDIELMVNSPGKIMQESRDALTQRDVTYDSFRDLSVFVDDIDRLLNGGCRVALCDSSFANGGDLQLISYLDSSDDLRGLTSYSGWNTNSNTVGTALSQAIVGKQNSVCTRRNVAYRIIEDALYQSSVRWRVTEKIGLHGGSYGDVLPCRKWAEDCVRDMLQTSYSRLKLSHRLPCSIREVRFPWNRMFEIDMDLV